MLSIVLTGGIGSGKSAVTDYFLQLGKDQGLRLIDSDHLARTLLQGSLKQSPSQALLQVKELFGASLFDSSGTLDRAKLRELVFNSSDSKQQLEALLHPLVYQSIFEQLENYRQQPDTRIVITAIPLFFETAFKTRHSLPFDRILVVDVPEQLQLERASKRDHCSSAIIQKIINSQVDRNTRLKHADDVIDNSGSLQQLKTSVEKLYRFYHNLAGGK